jgi:hypothetical protein
MKYSPDIGSTQHRWSSTFFTPAMVSAQTMAACLDRSSVMMPLRSTTPSRTMTLRPLGHQSFLPSADDAAANVIVFGCGVRNLTGKACDRLQHLHGKPGLRKWRYLIRSVARQNDLQHVELGDFAYGSRVSVVLLLIRSLHLFGDLSYKQRLPIPA